MPRKKEDWRGRGKVEVTRDAKGRFVSWKKAFAVFSGKKIAMYGDCRTKNGTYPARYEFYGGTGREYQQCMIIASRLPPRRRYVTVSVDDFLLDPDRYGTRGYWLEKYVNS
jgi:hypothetical protein